MDCQPRKRAICEVSSVVYPWLVGFINQPSHPKNVVVKTASQVLLSNEMRHLTALRGHPRIRQIIDSIEFPPSVVLEHAEEDLRSLSIRRKIHRLEMKTIALQLLEALSFVYSKNIVHTGQDESKSPNALNVNHIMIRYEATEYLDLRICRRLCIFQSIGQTC